MKRVLFVLVTLAAFTIVNVSAAEDLNEMFKKVTDLVAAKNYSKALDELGWAKKEIERMHMAQVQTFFPDTIGEFKGGKVTHNNALGFTSMERFYTKADGTEIKLSLTGSAGGGANEGLGGLMAFGKMAAMMDPAGQNTVRIGGRTATLNTDEEAKTGELSIFLDSGGILKLEMQTNGKAEVLKGFADSLKLTELDTYLKG
jgi:hypothetical protein